MSIQGIKVIELTPEVEARLEEVAARQGINVAALVQSIIRDQLRGASTAVGHRKPFYETATPEEIIRALDELADANRELPVLPRDAFDRESIYEAVP